MKLKTLIMLGAVIVGTGALLGYSPASINKSEPESGMDRIATAAFDAGAASMAMAIHNNPNISDMSGAAQVAEAHKIWLLQTTNAPIKAP